MTTMMILFAAAENLVVAVETTWEERVVMVEK